MSYSSARLARRISSTSRNPRVVTSAEWAPLRVITAFVVTVVPWNSVVTSDGSMPSARTPSTTPRSKRGGVDGTFATRDSPVSLTAKTSVNVPPVSQPTIQLTVPPRRNSIPAAPNIGPGRSRAQSARWLSVR
jgi:hypothetical protein